MRDVLDISTSHTRQTGMKAFWTGWNEIPMNPWPMSRQVRRRFRHDSTPTRPSGKGDYFRPTYYDAFDSQTRSVGGECETSYDFSSEWENQYVHRWDGWGSEPSLVFWGCDLLLHPAVPLSVRSRAFSSLYDSMRSNLDAGVALGEARQSYDLIINLLMQIRALFNKKTVVHMARGNLKEAASAFLGIKFGVIPLMADIYTAVGIISGSLHNPSLGYAKAVAMDGDFDQPPPVIDQWGYETIWSSGFSGKRGIEVKVHFGVTDPSSFELWQYGLTNPYSIAWELLTLSFVIDWFTGLGSFLRGLGRPLGLSFSHGYETRFVQASFTRTNRIGFGWEQVKGEFPKIDYRVRAMERFPLFEFTGPTPYLELGINPSKALSLIALILAKGP